MIASLKPKPDSHGTRYPALFAALADRFAKDEVKSRQQGGKPVYYVTARTVMNRLDAVLGPEHWWDDYQIISENAVLCRLTVRLPDGREVTKADAGGCAGMQDPGDDDKSGFSDALKRAAAKFGVGRYLYRDGVPQFVRDELAKPAPSRGPEDEDQDRPRVRTGEDLRRFLVSFHPGAIGPLTAWGRSQDFPKVLSSWSEGQVEQAIEWLARQEYEVAYEEVPGP